MAFGHFFSITSSRWKIGLGSLASLGIPCLSCHRALPALLVKVFRTYFQFLYMSNAPPDAFGFSHPQNRSTYMYEDIYIYIYITNLSMFSNGPIPLQSQKPRLEPDISMHLSPMGTLTKCYGNFSVQTYKYICKYQLTLDCQVNLP